MKIFYLHSAYQYIAGWSFEHCLVDEILFIRNIENIVSDRQVRIFERADFIRTLKNPDKNQG